MSGGGCALPGPAAPIGALPTVQRRGWRRWSASIFGLDLRSLAAYRILLGLVLLIDVATRLLDLEAHYTDFGVLPRSALFDEYLHRYHWTLHALSGWSSGVLLLFLLQIVAALALLCGYKTRLANVVCWLLWVSMNYRNPYVLNAGDPLLRALLFFSMFCPLGARWSIDSALHPQDRSGAGLWLGIGGCALVVQLCLVYVCTGVMKMHLYWYNGEALRMAFNHDGFATDLAVWLREFPTLCKIGTWSGLYLELFAPILLLLPLPRDLQRWIVPPLMIGFHLFIAATLHVGLFSLIAIAAWLMLLPPAFWPLCERVLRLPVPGLPKINLTAIGYDADCGFCKRMVLLLRGLAGQPRAIVIPTQQDEELQQRMLAENSWQLRRDDGAIASRYQAFLWLMAASPVLRWLYPLAAMPPYPWLGEHLYRWVATNRDRVAPLVGWLKPASPLPPPRGYHWLGRAFCLLMLILVVAWNLRTLDNDRKSAWRQELEILFDARIEWLHTKRRWQWLKDVQPLVYLCGLTQKWSMFAPYPTRDDGWFVMPGWLRDGTEVEIFNEGRFIDQEFRPMSDAVWDKPADVSDTYVRQRWRKYLMNNKTKSAKHHVWLGRYLTRAYHRAQAERADAAWLAAQAASGKSGTLLQAPPAPLLDRFEIWFVKETTNSDGSTAPLERVKLHSHRCFGTSKK